MIGSLTGKIVIKAPPQLLLEVGGVGYELEAPMSTFYGLPAVGETTRLLTHLVVREDAHILYAFGSLEERRLFRHLLKVQGVGPRIALAILSGTTVEGFAACVLAGDASALTKIPGVGRKTAERLVIEMRDRLESDQTNPTVAAEMSVAGPEGEAFSALVALGYKPAEATRLIKAVGAGATSTEDLIRKALQGAAK
jgi:Holliday junction DNA helicase RuvA